MAVQLNHTIVPSKDKEATAAFVAEILGLPAPKAFGPFMAVALDNDIALDFADWGDDFPSIHYAFLISEEEFDASFARITEKGLDYWADPFKNHPRQINTNNGGRGLYFEDPISGHYLEIITQKYAGT